MREEREANRSMPNSRADRLGFSCRGEFSAVSCRGRSCNSVAMVEADDRTGNHSKRFFDDERQL
jgi:hypothetical protein